MEYNFVWKCVIGEMQLHAGKHDTDRAMLWYAVLQHLISLKKIKSSSQCKREKA